jgi:hypothetical protein
MYAVNRKGVWNWVPGKYSFRNTNTNKDTLRYVFTITGNSEVDMDDNEYWLYLPIYNTVNWLKIGIPPNTTLDPLPVRKEKPIAIYGTSITQGGCATRAGMTWPAIVGRRLNQPVINLGFSGNGTLDKEMIALLTEIDAKIYVLDCIGNLVDKKKYPLKEVERRIIESVKMIRDKRPGTPILLPAFAAFSNRWLNKDRGVEIDEINETLRQAFVSLRASGIKNIFMLTSEDMNMGMDDTVDYGHPNDLGLTHYADAFEKIFRRIIERNAENMSSLNSQ